MTRLFELVNVLKKFDEPFIHYLFHLLKIILITVTDFHSIIFQQIVQLLLARTVIDPATSD